ncbi:MAG: sulfatase, partial [Candidatus Hydrogenedentes bacterium]|nr:sulfatase [Candidatus Hydrogenedentota bacterium]
RQSPLGCYGNKSNHTPNIDTIAQDGIFFKHVFTAAPWTRPSFASIFTSTYPSQHTAEHHNSLLPNDISTLAQMMQKQGYFTVGFAKTRFDGFVGPGAGFAKGFDVYFHYDDAKEVNKAFDNYLANNSEAFSRIGGGGVFIFHHFFDPHAPYENHFPEIIKNKGLLGDAKLQGTLLWEKLYPQSPGSANGKDIEYAVKVYESESAYVDTTIGTAITRLKDYKIYKDLNIIICADHGESFNEKYGVWNHGNPYATCTRVPLILRFPKTITPVPLIDNILISNLDIMPTILELAEIPIPNTLEGQSLLNLEDIDNNRFCISEDLKNGSLAIRNIRYKLVAIPAALPMVDHIDPYKFWKSIQPGTSDHAVTRNELESLREWIILRKNSPTKYELYDLILDPFENRDIATEEENIFHILYLELLRHCLKTGIITSDNLQWIREGSISNTEMESLKTVHISNGYQPEYLDLQEDTIEALKAQGYL